ncbi:MAG: hypothetical protein AAGA30_21870 [Planctomycetota bacterium]
MVELVSEKYLKTSEKIEKLQTKKFNQNKSIEAFKLFVMAVVAIWVIQYLASIGVFAAWPEKIQAFSQQYLR